MRVLVVEGDYRGWRDLIWHDHGEYEHALERRIAELQARHLVDPTAVVLAALVAGLQTRIETGPLVVDLLGDTVELRGRRLLVGPVEWDALVALARRLGQVVSYEELAAWLYPAARLHGGRPLSTQPSRSSLRATMVRLRRHLGDDADLVATVRTSGFMLRFEAPIGGA